jgi:hypothetical protein
MSLGRGLIATALFFFAFAAGAVQASEGYPPSVPLLEVRSVSQSVHVSGDPVDIYYPDPGGSAAGYRFPVVVYLQGAKVDKKYYSQFGQQLASYGFIVAIPNHPGLFTAANVLTEVFEHLKLQDVDSDSPLNGIVDKQTLVASGHSMGGSTVFAAINNMCFGCSSGEVFERPPELKAAVITASNPGVLDIQNQGIPTAIIVGSFNQRQDVYLQSYENIKRPRAFMVVDGADHFGMVDINEPPGAFLSDEEPPQTIPQSITVTRFAHWTGQYLRTWLYHDWLAWWSIQSGGDDFVSTTTD